MLICGGGPPVLTPFADNCEDLMEGEEESIWFGGGCMVGGAKMGPGGGVKGGGLILGSGLRDGGGSGVEGAIPTEYPAGKLG